MVNIEIFFLYLFRPKRIDSRFGKNFGKKERKTQNGEFNPLEGNKGRLYWELMQPWKTLIMLSHRTMAASGPCKGKKEYEARLISIVRDNLRARTRASGSK